MEFTLYLIHYSTFSRNKPQQRESIRVYSRAHSVWMLWCVSLALDHFVNFICLSIPFDTMVESVSCATHYFVFAYFVFFKLLQYIWPAVCASVLFSVTLFRSFALCFFIVCSSYAMPTNACSWFAIFALKYYCIHEIHRHYFIMIAARITMMTVKM